MRQAELEQQFHHAMQVYVSGKLETAATQFSQITQQWPTCVEAWFQRAEIAEQLQQLENAVAYYEKVLEQQPEIQEAWFRLGTIAAQQNAQSLALKYWQQALSINPDYPEANLHLGLLYAQQNPQEQTLAYKHFSRACSLTPDLLILLSLARTLLWQNQHTVVMILLDAALAFLQEHTLLTPTIKEQWRQALALRVQLAHEQREDDFALSLLSEPSPDAPFSQTLKQIYISLDANSEIQTVLKKNLQEQPLTENLSLEHAPRLLAWQKHGLQAEVNRYLLGDSKPSKPLQNQRLSITEHPTLNLVCVMHESALPLWPLYMQHLRSLPTRTWNIHIVLCHGLAISLEGLKAQVHRVQPATLSALVQTLSVDLFLHVGGDRQSTAIASALDCQSFSKPSLSWTPYGPKDSLWLNTPEDPCFSGVLLLKQVKDPIKNALHLHRWSVYLQHHLRQASGA